MNYTSDDVRIIMLKSGLMFIGFAITEIEMISLYEPHRVDIFPTQNPDGSVGQKVSFSDVMGIFDPSVEKVLHFFLEDKLKMERPQPQIGGPFAEKFCKIQLVNTPVPNGQPGHTNLNFG